MKFFLLSGQSQYLKISQTLSPRSSKQRQKNSKKKFFKLSWLFFIAQSNVSSSLYPIACDLLIVCALYMIRELFSFSFTKLYLFILHCLYLAILFVNNNYYLSFYYVSKSKIFSLMCSISGVNILFRKYLSFIVRIIAD